MNNSQNKETVRKFYEECLNKKNFVLMRELLSPDFTGANGEKGADAFEQNVKPLMTGLPDVQWKVEDIIQEGDKVAVRHSLKGTNTGIYRGLPPTGKVITNDGILIFQLKGDKIIAVWTQTDRLGFNQQIGIIPMNLIPARPQKIREANRVTASGRGGNARNHCARELPVYFASFINFLLIT